MGKDTKPLGSAASAAAEPYERMSALTKRVVVRISAELEQWIAAQAELEGLDNATWVRSHLTKTMRGLNVMPRNTVALPDHLANLTDPTDAEWDEINPIIAKANETPASPSEPIDVDAMVEQSLAEAEENGLTQLPPEPEQPTASVRPVFRRPAPYSMATQPGWIK